MDERRMLMAAIVAHPDEDTPRLALADWLQEHGDRHDRARGEFIRCQIAAHNGGPDARGASKRASVLRSAHVRHWLGPLWALSSRYNSRTFTRGILDDWLVWTADFLKKGSQEAVCEWFPRLGVKRLILREATKRVELLARSPALAWVATLRWHDAKLEDKGFVALAASPHLERLSRLEIDKPRCSDAGLKALARSNRLPNLRALGLVDGLWRGAFSAPGVRQILDSDRFPRFDELDLRGAHTSAATHRALFTYKNLARLRVLELGSHCNVTALATCPHLTNLEELRVADSRITDPDARALADNPAFGGLKVLALTRMNANHAPLALVAERALRDRFGAGLTLKYSVLCRGR